MEKPPRIIGFDFARGLAIIGMVIVNFKTVMVVEDDSWLNQLLGLLSGKAAALFVTLAGVGMTLMYQGAQRKNNPDAIKKVKTDLLKRALFLFVVGLSYYFIWPADILHYYGVYMVIGVLLIGASTRRLQWASLFAILVSPMLMLFLNYEAGWNWNTLEYTDFFTPEGFFRNLLFNGFHPVFPWVAFLLSGIWVGRLDFLNPAVRKKTALVSFGVFVLVTLVAHVLLLQLSSASSKEEAELWSLFVGTEPMPPTVFYMLSAIALSVFLISVSVSIGLKFAENIAVKHLVSAGQLALSNYFFHVVIGMLAAEVFFGKLEGGFSAEFAFFYALIFSLILVLLSDLWRKKYSRGPLEQLMRKVTG